MIVRISTNGGKTINVMKYLVGLRCGGLMEDPRMYFSSPFDVIEATSKQEAKETYNNKHKCNYFYGGIMCSFDSEGNINDIDDDCSKNDCKYVLHELGAI